MRIASPGRGIAQPDWMSVMWVAAGNETSGKAGSRYPALFLKISEKTFHASFSMRDGKAGNVATKAKSKMKLNKFYKWKFTQTVDSAGKVGPQCEVRGDLCLFQYWYEVLLGGSSLLKVPSTNTNTYKDVKIYAGLNSLPKGPDSFGIPLGEYRNLVFGN